MRRAAVVAAGIFASAILASRGSAQTVDYTKVRQYVGEDVTVQGPVARVDRIAGGVVRFSIGATYSRRTLEVLIAPEFVPSLESDLRSYEGKVVEVRGRITTGEAEGITGRTSGSSTIPAIVLQDINRLKVIATSEPKKPS
jgi:hypothetical protein